MRRSFIAVAFSASLLAGCSNSSKSPATDGSTPPPTTTPPPAPPPSFAVDPAPPPTGPSPVPPPNVGQGLRISAPQGLYLLTPPLAGEPAFQGPVLVELNGTVPPPDTTLDLNGVRLFRTSTSAEGSGDKFWAIDTAVPQPPLRSDGAVVLTARSGSQVRSLTLPCPADIGVTVSAQPGATLTGAEALRIAWAGDLAVNLTNSLVTDFYASAHLRGVDLASGAFEPGRLSQKLVPHQASEVVLDVPATAAATSGYAAELRWQGAFVKDFTSDGFCGRVKRLLYAR